MTGLSEPLNQEKDPTVNSDKLKDLCKMSVNLK